MTGDEIAALVDTYLGWRDRAGFPTDHARDRGTLTRFAAHLAGGPVTAAAVRGWLAGLSGYDDRTRRLYRARVSALLDWCVRTGRLDTNPLTPAPSRAELLRRSRPPSKGDLSRSSTSEAGLAYVAARAKRGEFMPRTATHTRTMLMFFAATVGNPDAANLTRRHVETWMEVPGSPATRRYRFSTVRMFTRWLVRERVLARDPFEGLKAPREPRRVPRALDRADVVRAVDAASADRRMRLVLLLMVQEGLRCVEVAGLQTGDIDQGERTMLVHGKGGHERLLPLSDETWSALWAYRAETPSGAGPLVRSRVDPDRGITPTYLSTLVARHLADCGVKLSALDGRTAHAFRHTFATDALRNGAHLRDLQAALGHASLQTTERYLSREVKGLRAAMGGRTYTGCSAPVEA